MSEPVENPITKGSFKKIIPTKKLNVLFLFDTGLTTEFVKENKSEARENAIIKFLKKEIVQYQRAINQVVEKITREHPDYQILFFSSLSATINNAVKILDFPGGYTHVPIKKIPVRFPELSRPKEANKRKDHELDYLVSFWDGVDDGIDGGTGHLIRRWLNVGFASDSFNWVHKDRYYLQYLVSTPDNHFPVARYFKRDNDLTSTFQTSEDPVARYIKKTDPSIVYRDRKYPSFFSIWPMLLLLLAVTLTFVSYLNGVDGTFTVTVIFSVIIFFICAFLWDYFKNAQEILSKFAFPIVLAAMTIGLGAYGFRTYSKIQPKYPDNKEYSMNWGDCFFAAANLITLNASVLSEDSIKNKPNNALLTARIFGGFTATYAFLLAFSFAAGRENMDRLKFWKFRIWNLRKKPMPFIAVLGNGEMAVKLAIDLERQNKRVVFFDNGHNPSTRDVLKGRNIWYFNGHVTYNQDLLKTYFWKAEDVYIIGESDEENFRTTQELDEIYYDRKEKASTSSHWYIHLRDRRKRELIKSFTGHPITSFSIEQNTARRLLSRFPIDRFRHKNYNPVASTQVIILGFTELAKELALTCLKLGHFEPDKSVRVIIYYYKEEFDRVTAFKNTYTALFKKADPFYKQDKRARKVQRYTFFKNSKSVISFRQLPTSETDICNKNWELYQDITPDRITSIYSCLPSGIESAAILGSILPRLEWIKQGKDNHDNKHCDIQVFCHYNFPDEEEKTYIESKLNKLTPSVPIFFFGNQLKECTERAIKSEQLDHLAKEIAFIYEVLYKYDQIEAVEGKRKFFDIPQKDISVIPQAKLFFEQLTPVKQAKETRKLYIKELNKRWELLSENHRESNRQAADHALIKYRIRNLDEFVKKAKNILGDKKAEKNLASDIFFNTISESGIPNFAEIEHRRWCAEKLIDGYLPLGKDKIANWTGSNKGFLKDQKIHRDLVPFEKISHSEKTKDISGVMGAWTFLSYSFKKKT